MTRGRFSIAVVLFFSLNVLAAGPAESLALMPGPHSMTVTEVIDGKSICRLATIEEARAFSRTDVPLHVMYPEPGRVRLNTGLQITLLATEQLEANPTAKAAFIRAAQTWESRIGNPVSITIKADFGTTRFGVAYPSENIIGSANGGLFFVNYPAARAALLARADTAAETALYNQLPVGAVPTNLGSVTQVLGTISQLKTLGFTLPADALPDIGFNSAFPFDFDPSNGITPGLTDFDAITVHELGHVLGFFSLAGYTEQEPSADVSPTIWDLFRFRPGVTLATFQSTARSLSSGGEHVSFFGGASLPMSTGRPDGSGGDGQQSSHWKDDTNGNPLIGLMDPTAPDGRGTLTQNDLDAFATMGYTIVSGSAPATPVPTVPGNLGATLTSSTVARLTWTDSTNETLYVVERKINGGAYLELGTAPANTTVANVENLQQGVTYTFRVKARNAAGDSAYSNEASVSTGGTSGPCVPNATTVCLANNRFRVSINYVNPFSNPPNQPGTFLAARLLQGVQNPDTALFGFSSAQAVEVVVRVQDTRPFAPRFDIYYGGMTDVGYTVTVTDTVTGTTRQYQNQVGKVGGGADRNSFPASALGTDDRMISSGGMDSFYDGERLQTSTARFQSLPRPKGSAGVLKGHATEVISSATALEIDESRISMTAKARANAGGGGACTEIEPNNSTGLADTLTFGEPCTGFARFTDGGDITITYPGGTVDFIEDVFRVSLSASATLDTTLTFTNGAADLDLFLIRINGSSLEVLEQSNGSMTTERVISDPLPAGTYYFGVSAFSGESNYTITATTTGTVPQPPAAPSNLTATLTSNTSASLMWIDHANNETEYRLERKVNGGAYAEFPDVAPANTTGASITGLSAGSTYTFRVRARNAAGSSGYSNEASVTTPGGPVSGPCVANSTTVCLANNRFRVSINYVNPFSSPPNQPGTFLAARLLQGAQNPDTALFGFSSAQAVEVVVRVQDTRPFAPRFDIYYGGMTDVGYTVTVTDTQTGTTRTYVNTVGTVGGGVDRNSFPAN